MLFEKFQTFLFLLLLTRGASGRQWRRTFRRNDDVNPMSRTANLTAVIRDVVLGLPVHHVNLLYDNFSDSYQSELLIKTLHRVDITTSVYLIRSESVQEQFCQYVRESLSKHQDVTNVVFSNKNTAVDLFWMAQQQDLIHRRILYIFYWDHQIYESEFYTVQYEAMRVAVISSPKSGIYRIYYSQADAYGSGTMTLVNWWSPHEGLFRHPLLPPPEKVYRDFRGRLFEVPVIHKPPWNFVEYTNDSFKADGGRDDKLLTLMADKLNFRYKYVDPPERLQGSGPTENGTFPGVLGQVWQREVNFFMGDVTITYERAQYVEFSFFTLVDSEAFVTHKPSKLNEAFALVRPFHWQVWPPIIATYALYGPFLFLLIDLPYEWIQVRRSRRERKKLFWNCVWFSTATFLRQGGTHPVSSHKARLVLILVTLGVTYVIGDMYSANLTSLLARPGREQPIRVLEELELAMKTRGYQLLVEKHSSSYSTLQNGTGIYERLWKIMQTQQQFMIESVESGMKLVRKKRNIAILGGRETLFFDIKRFGSYNFQLSEKLNTRYAGIAVQVGCPFLENFNKILMQLFESGILVKMTEEEYERLGEKQRAAVRQRDNEDKSSEQEEVTQKPEVIVPQTDTETPEAGIHQVFGLDSRHQLKPLNTKMLQGAFYILVIGYFLSSVILMIEIKAESLREFFRCRKLRNACDRATKKCDLHILCSRLRHRPSTFVQNFLNDLLHVQRDVRNMRKTTKVEREFNETDGPVTTVEPFKMDLAFLD